MDVKTNVTGHGDSTASGKITVLMYPYGTSTMTFHRPLGAGVTYEDITITMNENVRDNYRNGPTAIKLSSARQIVSCSDKCYQCHGLFV